MYFYHSSKDFLVNSTESYMRGLRHDVRLAVQLQFHRRLVVRLGLCANIHQVGWFHLDVNHVLVNHVDLLVPRG